ncbi:MAG: C26 family cysteine hydrolase domain-containing family [Acidobacteria bacterium]|nr:C26 family cysteine hydrolase domain-containing family [Acidobacteriota bacterium]
MKELWLLGDRDVRFMTHRALDAVIAQMPGNIRARWVGTDSREVARSADADGVWVVPGTPYRDNEAVYRAIERARVAGQPFLGTCGGFQYAVVEFARHVAGISDAAHAESEPDALKAVISQLPCSLVGQKRTIAVTPGTRLHRICGAAPFVGFHWCNFGVSPSFVDRLTEHGLVVSARADDAGVEAVELPGHPFYLATLFQPQVGSLDGEPLHPIIAEFVAAI